jgi:hypothetical protein
VQVLNGIQGDCIVSISVTASSRIDTVVSADLNTALGIMVANKVAHAVAATLPPA